ncbi:DUF5666 domain-containing protein [Motilimonas sp. E26]|uniref:DUF5666 domain-containing protein n=1 Tax=Motilimonas sp. E26 TaxID=2865674 RepID=UPI001E4D6500|nr:DUF5666 domain-containing protein [Motilimonas sp. E26]
MMKLSNLAVGLGALVIGSTLVACGGGSTANRGGGIGGTGVALSNNYSGVISGFGSIYVNGVRFNTDNSQFFVNGKLVNESALAMGMLVRVEGDAEGESGTANKVYFDAGIKGPVSGNIQIVGRNQIMIPVMGVTAVVDSQATEFAEVTFEQLQQNADLLKPGSMLELSGFYNAQGQFQVSYFELETAPFVANVSEVQMIGNVTNLSDTQFSLVVSDGVAPFTISLATANFDGELAEGERVKVEGTLNTIDSQDILALEIDSLTPSEQQEVELQGLISALDSQTSFTLNGITVDASAVQLESELSVDLLVEVEGVMVNKVLVAESIEVLRRKDEQEVSLSTRVESVDLDAQTLSLSAFGQPISVVVNKRTKWDDDRDDVRRFNLEDIAVGDYLELDLFESDSQWVAEEVEREESEADVMLEVELASAHLDAANQQVNVAGFTLSLTAETDIEGGMSVADFFTKAAQLDEVVLIDTNGDQQIDKILLDD